MKLNSGLSGTRKDRASGFSMLELMVVVVVIMIMMALAIPSALNMLHIYRLRNACSEFSGLVQQGRSRSVRDSSYYAIRYVSSTPITEAYVDIAKNSTLTTTCTTTAAGKDCDPVVSWAPEVVPVAASGSGVPNSSALQSAWLPSASAVTIEDGFTNPITFSPMGLPCIANTTTNVCNSSSSATINTAYWMFFENTVTQQWEAVTVTPAGKVQKWAYTGGWSQL